MSEAKIYALPVASAAEQTGYLLALVDRIRAEVEKGDITAIAFVGISARGENVLVNSTLQGNEHLTIIGAMQALIYTLMRDQQQTTPIEPGAA